MALSQPQTKYLTVREAAAFLGVAMGTLRNWVCRSKYEADPLPYAKFSSRCLRFPEQSLIQWAERRGMNRVAISPL
jgi:predicted DNA-binding transcriptional regulator AlpA